jgi:uncharacterized membrane protein HdeD (DUF308 family)
MKAEEWQQALGCFQEIQRLVPDDREIGKLLARVRQELTSPPKVEVPDLSGQTLSQAHSSLASKGLELSVNEEVPSDTLAEGEIIEQSPEPETEVLAGSSVCVTVSSGPHEVSVPAPPGNQTRDGTYRRMQTPSLLPAHTGSWWAMALKGLVLVIFALPLFGESILGPTIFPETFRLYSALMITAYGIVTTIDARTRADRSRPLLIQGRISILLGLFIFLAWLVNQVLQSLGFAPRDTLMVIFRDIPIIPYLVSSWAIFIGFIRIIAAIQLRWETRNLWLMGASGVSLALFGIPLLRADLHPNDYPWGLLGFLALVSGIALIAVALRVRDR